jgi:hypothetical protein
LHPAKPELPDARQEGNQDSKCHAQSQPYVFVFHLELLASAILAGSNFGKKNPSRPAARNSAIVAQQSARKKATALDMIHQFITRQSYKHYERRSYYGVS